MLRRHRRLGELNSISVLGSRIHQYTVLRTEVAVWQDLNVRSFRGTPALWIKAVGVTGTSCDMLA